MSAHQYVSTACRHDLHGQCRERCKHCGAACGCLHHGARVRVRRLSAGCWEVCCPCCVVYPVVGQVGTWERAMYRATDHARWHRVLSSGDPEPPVWTKVRDAAGRQWQNWGCCAVPWESKGACPQSWTQLVENHGPVTVMKWGDDE